MNLKLNPIIKKYLSFATLITYSSFNLLGSILVNLINLNDASGWQMQIRNSGINGILEISLILFFLTYLAIDIKKKYRNILISKLHLISISICAIINNFGNIDISIYLSVIIGSIVLFLINLYLIRKNVAQHRL